MQTAEVIRGPVPQAKSFAASKVKSKASSSRAKRAFDITFAFLLIAFLLPALLVIALLVKLDSKGPVIFRQKRSGLNGELFQIFKFRSMTCMEDGDTVRQAQAGDMRVTRIGRILRRTSLDELPQIFNIFNGDMSFVGPRPHALSHDKVFAGQVADYDRRFEAKPGLTGLAQVRGFRGEIRETSDLTQRIEADIEYIDNWSFSKDVGIFFGTVKVVFGDRNAY